ncbi:TetR family transcriptional regulator [Xenorhabdus mauleonii]|nr:TetR family transcriptional regulator [Xenorhabdus mauleonii]
MARKTKNDALETREQILNAAEWCYNTKGIGGTTLNMIAQKANCTRGAIYWHFRDQSDILQALLARSKWTLQERLEEIVFFDSNILTNIRSCLIGYLNEVQTDVSKRYSLETLIYQCDFSQGDEKLLSLQQGRFSRIIELLVILFCKAKEYGELQSSICCHTAALLVGYTLVGGLKINLINTEKEDITSSIIYVFDMVFLSLPSFSA